MISDDVFAVLRDYPRIYLACHMRHPSARKRGGTITGRDASILAHIAVGELRPRDLVNHMGLARSTVSEAINRLIGLQLVEVRPASGDRRAKALRITASGKAAIEHQSVLDAALVAAALKRLTRANRRTVVAGLKLLADTSSAIRQTAKQVRR